MSMSRGRGIKRLKGNAVLEDSSSSSDDFSDDDAPLVGGENMESSESEDCESDSDDSFSTKVAKKRVTRRVRKDYNSGIKRLRLFAEKHGFQQCIENGSLKTPMPLDLVKAFFEHLSSCKVPWRSHGTPGKMKNYAPKSLVRVQAMIHDLYRQRFQTVQPQITSFFCNFNRWYLLQIAELMSAVPPEYPVDKISMPLCHDAWRLLLLRVWQAKPRPGCTWASIAHLRTFLNQAKTMLGRSERVTRSSWETLEWRNDALAGKIPTSKSDQGGDLSYSKLMYPSVSEPESCVVLCLALDVCSKNRFDDLESFRAIYPNSFQTNLHTTFRLFIDNMAEEDKAAMQVGTCFRHLPITLHTPKRTGAVRLHAHCEAVHWNSCRQRGDHKVDTEDSYLRYPSEAQDGIMGRILAGLPFGSHGFEAQAPHFSREIESTIPFKKLIPGYDKFPVSLRSVFPYFIASIVWHQDWLRKTLPSDSPVWSSVPLFTTQTVWLEKLSAKDDHGNFIHILGGRVGARSVLPLTGKSYVSDDHAMLVELRDSFQDFLASWNARCSGPAAVAPISTASIVTSHVASTPASHTVTRQVSQIYDLLVGNAIPAANGRLQPCPQLQIVDLPSTFKIPTGLRPEQLFNKWFCRFGPVPAWMYITKKQMKTQGRVQRDLFNKYEKVMHYIIGPASVDFILKDVEASFEGCWSRVCDVAGWPLSTRWSCSTVYDKLSPELRDRLDRAPPFHIHPATPALLQNARVAQGIADTAAVASISASVNTAVSAALSDHIPVIELPSAFRIPDGMTVERLWNCWHTVCTVSGFTSRWRDCDLMQLLRELHRKHDLGAAYSTQKSLLSKSIEVLKVLQSCAPLMTNEEIDDDAGAAFASCAAVASVTYGEIFRGTVRTVYNKMMLAKKNSNKM
jgi:hypothetical protein